MAMVHRLAVTLIRHGLTKANQEKRYVGSSDPPLSEEGKIELEKLVHKSAGYLSPDFVLSSDRRRCVETAKILYPRLPVQLCEEFKEVDFGDWENKTYADLCGDLTYQNWISDPKKVCPPNGEGMADFERRVLSGWHKVVSLFDKDDVKHVVILTHGGPIRYLLSQFVQDERSFWEWNTPHGQGYTLTWEGVVTGRCTLLQAEPLMVKQNG